MAKLKLEKERKVTFQSKDALVCPACDTHFFREELLSGGGRLIAGPLSDELRRMFEVSNKFGEINPLIYQPTVCPACWFASWDVDFVHLPVKKREEVMNDKDARLAETQLLFAFVDFNNPRDLESGAAATYLALRCYRFYPKEFSPTIKQAITSLRCGWLFDDLHAKRPGEHFDWLSLLFKQKANFLYHQAILGEQSGKETLSGVRNYGPDLDKNYGYEGALYVSSLLEQKYGSREDLDQRIAQIGEAKRTIAKIFGLGKSSKAKPGPLLEKARDLYDAFNEELHETDE